MHQRARACAEHLKALQLEDDSGALVRFCQRCSKWEPLTAFEVRSPRAAAQAARAQRTRRGRTAVGTIRPKVCIDRLRASRRSPAPQGVKRTCTAQLLVHNERRRAEYARSKASAVRSGAQQTQQLPQADQGAMPGLAQPTAAMIQQYVAAAVAAATSAQAAAQVQVAPAAAQHHATAQQLTQVAPPGQPQAAALAAAAAALQNGGAGGAEVGPNGFQAALAGMLVGLLSNGAQQPQQATQQPAPTVTPEIWQQLMAQQRPQ